ncbi:uncharacterized protein [Chironomus tepperi]|uniref:uncharacterized protein isoform X1 n=1 Tax=Chironomus tepperi TaxID=113505 RepID=UPI00391F335D
MSMRSKYEVEEPVPRSKCVTCLCVSWKVFSCVFSHVTLIAVVVAYCVFGAVLFEKLESEHEEKVRNGTVDIRKNTTFMIWNQTDKMMYLKQEVWINETIRHLMDFETQLLKAMKDDGWDGYPPGSKPQWTFSGSLFYSIIVITTIGYGHIAPKTIPGKISTIFYAIVGIPLMLLCLSNIGDIMASSFRFIYWRVCCYVCTREPKKQQKRRMMMRRQQLQQQQQLALQERSSRYSGRSNQASMRRSMRASQRSTDSGIDPYYERGQDDKGRMGHAYSDMDCRYSGANGNGEQQQLYYDEREKMRGRSLQRPRREQMRDGRFGPGGNGGGPSLSCDTRYRNDNRYADRHTVDRERFPNYQNEQLYDNDYDDDVEQQGAHISRRERMREREKEPPNRQHMRYSEDRQMGMDRMDRSPRVSRGGPASRVQSLDRRMMRRDPVMIEFEQEQPCKAPMYCNKYAVDDEMDEKRPDRRQQSMRSQSMPRQMQSRFGDRLMPPHQGSLRREHSAQPFDENDIEMPPRKGRKQTRPAVQAPSPRIMSPMGFAVHRQARHIASVMDENSMYGEDWDYYGEDAPPMSYIKPVPIWLCVFLVVGYILGGAFLFRKWEGWDLLDAAYFCFITLTTIGFGDFVPAQGAKANPEISIALCSVYLLFGIALLAMSFNLVQEEVIAKVKSVARRLGIIKDDEEQD